jgi:hypothetical protein
LEFQGREEVTEKNIKFSNNMKSTPEYYFSRFMSFSMILKKTGECSAIYCRGEIIAATILAVNQIL